MMSLSGGLGEVTRQRMQLDGYYDRFAEVVEREYTLAFGTVLAGEDLEYGLPTASIPTNILGDFTTCTSSTPPSPRTRSSRSRM